MAENSGHRRHDVLVTALAKGESITTAAKLSGFSARTVNRRVTETAFREEVQQVRNGLVATAAGRIAGLMDDAADALRELLRSQTEAIRLSAARTVFDVALRLKECAELEGRLAAVEGRLNVQPATTNLAG